MDVKNVYLVLRDGERCIAFSADPRLIRTVAGAMAVDYRGHLSAVGTPTTFIEQARIGVLDAIANADITGEAEGEEVAKPWWESAFDIANEEVNPSQE